MDTLSPRQHRAIGFLMTEPTILAAAKKTRVAERTLRRWIEDPAFARVYREARRQALTHVTSHLQEVACEAVTTLKALMTDEETPRSSRIAAARTILEFGYRAGDLEGQEQLRELERKVGELQATLFERSDSDDGHR